MSLNTNICDVSCMAKF